MINKKNFYITTPIYYASGNIHIGHTYCCVCADAIARFKRMAGYNVRFMTGSDEHGEKIEKNATEANLTPQKYVDNIQKRFKDVWKTMNISYDYYVRTTDNSHIETVKKVFTKLLSNGDIYKGKYTGLYCTHCESFWTENQCLKINDKLCCPDCKREVHVDSEDAYFLNVKKYSNWLLDFYSSHPGFLDEDKMNEMKKTFIEPGLEDLCITRTSFSWGIPIDEDKRHIVYVWIDALLNYVSALGYLNNQENLMDKFWSDNTNIVHLIGRDITRFHTIYWPILLKALDLREPDKVIVHGLLLTKSGVKLSKSLGNAITPEQILQFVSVDALRYYMIREIEFTSDGTFTPVQFVDRINSDLANNYGNLINRTLSMINKYLNGVTPKYEKPSSLYTSDFYNEINKKVDLYDDAMENLKITRGAQFAMDIVSLAHKYFDDMAPWQLASKNDLKTLNECLYAALEACRISSILLYPFMPDKCSESLQQANLPTNLCKYNTVKKIGNIPSNKINTLSVLFPRLKKEEIIDKLENLINNKQ